MIPAIYQTISRDLQGSSHYSSSQHSREDDSHSQTSFGEAPTFIGSLYPPSSSATQSHSLTLTAPALPALSLPFVVDDDDAAAACYRPTSTSTVRGATSMPSIGRETPASSEQQQQQYSALHSQIQSPAAGPECRSICGPENGWAAGSPRSRWCSRRRLIFRSTRP